MSSIDTRTSTATVEHQQLAENLVVGDVRRPTVRGSYRRIKGYVRIGVGQTSGATQHCFNPYATSYVTAGLTQNFSNAAVSAPAICSGPWFSICRRSSIHTN